MRIHPPEWVSGNIFIRPNELTEAGDKIEGHTHAFDHTTFVLTGAVKVRVTFPSGRIIERDFTAPAHFLVKAEATHEITALVDGTKVWCVYSHRDPQGRVHQVYDGWREAYQ